MTYDLDILGEHFGEANLFISDKAVSGVAKLVQRVLVLLFTDVNGEYSAGRGTFLSQEISSANNRDDDVIQGRFAIAASHVKEEINNSTPFDVPADEVLEELNILSLEREREDHLLLEIQVVTENGDSVSVKAPVNVIGDQDG